jgi:acetate kinase
MSTSAAGTAQAPPSRQASQSASLLTINGGSSSLKFALYEVASAVGGSPRRTTSGIVERVGSSGASMTARAAPDAQASTWHVTAPDLAAAADLVIDWILQTAGRQSLAGVGFRVVHGGPRFFRPDRVTPALIAELRRIVPLDEDHLPGQIALMERFGQRLPELPAIACFDTSFHHDMPRMATVVPIPRKYESAGIRRYGFHGLAYNFLTEEIARVAGPSAAAGRLVLAHLGSGASMAAVHGGRPIDTTMGLTPCSGLLLSTRCGDVDPELSWYLAETAGMSARAFHRMVNHESGLVGISETSPDVRDLLANRATDVRAAEAVAIFCYRARKAIGGLAAALGGLDLLVFSGGIGENSPDIRAEICAGLEFLGITLDPKRNVSGDGVITTDHSRTKVRVIRADEESIIARESARLLHLQE